MYLSKVNLSDNNKLLYLDLATLLITAEPRRGSYSDLLEQFKPLENGSLLLGRFGNSRHLEDDWFVPSIEEIEALKVCMFELGDFRGSLASTSNNNLGKYVAKELDSENTNYQILLYSFSKRDYISSVENFITEAASKPEYKKQVLMNFIDLGVELSDIDQKKTDQALVQLPEVRIKIIKSILEQIFEHAQFDELPLTERKILLFELVALAHADGSVHELEEVVVNTVADKFKIDEETLEELKGAAQEIITAVNDAAEIIFE